MCLAMDLHLHTTYSDGKNLLEDVCNYSKEKQLKWFSITDHNTISGTLALDKAGLKPHNLLYGTEFRLPRLPDLLVYFPLMEKNEAQKLENELLELRELDQVITVAIANDFIQDDPIKQWQKSRFFNQTGNFWLGTMQLAQLVTNQSLPDADLIKRIRKKKSELFRTSKRLNAADQLLERSTVEWVSLLAKRYRGEIVFAHPYREIARDNHEKKQIKYNDATERLRDLFDKAQEWNISAIEYTLEFSQKWWKNVFSFEPNTINDCFFSLCNEYNMHITTGSDSHWLFSKDDIIDLRSKDLALAQHMPKWLL